MTLFKTHTWNQKQINN